MSVETLKRDLLAAIDKDDPCVALFKPYMESMPEDMIIALCQKVDENRPMLELLVGKDNTVKLLPVIQSFNQRVLNSSPAAKPNPS